MLDLGPSQYDRLNREEKAAAWHNAEMRRPRDWNEQWDAEIKSVFRVLTMWDCIEAHYPGSQHSERGLPSWINCGDLTTGGIDVIRKSTSDH